MPLTNVMSEVIPDALIGGTAFARFDAANSHIGVGNGTAAFSAAQTDLQGAQKLRKPAVDGTPTRAGNVVTITARFGPTEANFRWEEWGWFNGPNPPDHATEPHQMASRRVIYIGEKTPAANATWEFEVEVAFSIAEDEEGD